MSNYNKSVSNEGKSVIESKQYDINLDNYDRYLDGRRDNNDHYDMDNDFQLNPDEGPEFEMFEDDSFRGKIGVVKREIKSRLSRAATELKNIFAQENVTDCRVPWHDSKRETAEAVPCPSTSTPTTSTARTSAGKHKLRILEVFTFTCMVTRVAFDRGWHACAPISIEAGYDLLTRDGRQAAWERIEAESPDALVVAWPCDPWSAMQNLNRRRPDTWLRVLHRRRQHRALTRFATQCELWQTRHNKIFLGENPITSQAWKLPEITRLRDRCHEALPHMCACQLRDPETGLYLRMATRIVTASRRTAQRLSLRCLQNHY